MARTADVIQAEIDALRATMATGATEIEFQGQRTRYGSAEDMLVRIAALERELADVEGTGRTHHLAVVDKGT